MRFVRPSREITHEVDREDVVTLVVAKSEAVIRHAPSTVTRIVPVEREGSAIARVIR
jgi:hypothetical protein